MTLYEPPRAATPALARERYEFLDVLRGVALSGIVIANMISYSLYLYLPELVKETMSTAAIDKGLDFLELVAVEGKFYTIFSVLFGVGFSILDVRVRSRGVSFGQFYNRRAGILCAIGLTHAVLFWHNDILVFYALCGALLLPFVQRSNLVILATSVLALLTPTLMAFWGGIPRGTLAGPRDFLLSQYGLAPETRVVVWTEGSYLDVVLLNVASWFGNVDYVATSGMLFRIYGCFLLGLWIGKNEIYRHLDRYAATFSRVATVGIAAGVPLNLMYARTFESDAWPHTLLATVAILTLAAGYTSIVALAWVRGHSRILQQTFAPVGRMALTNYVGQSVICMFIFRSVGLGLGGQVGPAVYLPLGLVIYVVQLFISKLWLRRYHFGPLEWVWRMLTYGSRVPLVKAA